MNHPDFNSITKNFSLLLEVEDYDSYTAFIKQACFELGDDETFKGFLASEEFGKNLQKRIAEDGGLVKSMDCISYVSTMNPKAAEIILTHRGFAQSVFPAKINNESDVNIIGLCFEVVGNHVQQFAEIVLQNGDFDLELFIEKINFDEDLYNIGHALERIQRVSPLLTETIVEHQLFDHNRIKELLGKEQDSDKVGEYQGAIKNASPEKAKSIYNL